MKRTPIDFVPEGSRLTFIERSGNTMSKSGKIDQTALYKCACGATIIKVIHRVKAGNTKSCGCLHIETVSKLNKTHGWGGGERHPLFRIWGTMIDKCYNKNSSKYKYYGAVGVTMCEEWRNSYPSFYDWCMSNGWRKGLVIDKDVKSKKLGVTPKYCPALCSIITQKENTQRENRTRHKL